MRKFQSEVPPGKLELRSCRVCRYEFDGGFLSFWPAVLGEVHRAMVRAAQILSQREFPGDDPAFPLVPCLGHIAPRFAARVNLRGCIRVPRPGYIEERAPQGLQQDSNSISA